MADKEFNELLISLVQERPSLYDLSRVDYHNKDIQDKLWKQVAEVLTVSGEFNLLKQLLTYIIAICLL